MWFFIEQGANIADSLIISYFLFNFLSLKKQYKPKKWLLFGLLFIVQFSGFYIEGLFYVFEGLAIWLDLVILFVYSLFFFKDFILYKFLASAVLYFMIQAVTAVTAVMISVAAGVPVIDLIAVQGPLRLVTIIAIKTLMFVCVKILIRTRKQAQLNGWEWAGILASIIILSYTIDHNFRSILGIPVGKYENFISIILCASAIFILYFLFGRISANNKAQVNALEKKGLAAELASGADYKETIEKVLQYLHDFKQTAIAVLHYAGHIDQVKGLIEPYIEIVSGFVMPVVVDDMLLGNFATTKKRQAVAAGVKINFSIDPSLSFKNFDMAGKLLGNLIDNAIEASAKSKDKLVIIIMRRIGNTAAIDIMNTADPESLKTNKGFSTSKVSAIFHGHGLRNINDIIEKYEGNCDKTIDTLTGSVRHVITLPYTLEEAKG